MKTLYLIRHAKSDWSHPDQDDFDRGVNERGEKAIQVMNRFLRNRDITPDVVLSSPAKRAKITAEWIIEKLDYKKKNIVYKGEIYDTHMNGYERALSCIMEQESNREWLFFIGHNYAITQLAEYLSGKSIWNMPTCSIVCLQFDIEDWSEISYGNGEIIFFESPKSVEK